MKKNTLRRILALVLVIAMFGSDLALVTTANNNAVCGIEDHDHTDACYASEETVPATETEPAATETVPMTEPAATETIPATEAPVETTPATEPAATEIPTEPECTCGAEADVHSADCERYVPTFIEKLLITQTLKALHDALMADAQAVRSLTAEELTALKTHAEALLAALEEPTEDDRDYYALIIETVEVLLGEMVPEGDPEVLADKLPPYEITINGTTYKGVATNNQYNFSSLTSAYQIYICTLVDALFEVLKWESQGNADSSGIYGTIDGNTLTGLDEVYAGIYDLLLLADTRYEIGYDGSEITECPHNETKNTTVIWKIKGTVPWVKPKTISNTGRIIIVSEDDATIQFSAEGRCEITGNTGANRSAIAVLGRPQKKITITGSEARKANVFEMTGGSMYLRNCEITNFTISKSSSAVITFKKENVARYLYMSHCQMHHVTGYESPGIFCMAYGDTSNSYAKDSKIYLYENNFYNCTTTQDGASTHGGPVIRSYAADVCTLQARNCTFSNNRVGTGTSYKASTGTGGGAIYWKSVAGKASIVNCTFTGNSSTTVGGAIYNTGSMEIIGCTFNNNLAYGNGGAIAAETPYTSSVYSSVSHNQLSGSLSLDSNTKIMDNEAKKAGGGVYFEAYASQIGGANQIETYQMQLYIRGATISGNTAGTNGGGMAMMLDYEDRSYTTGIAIEEGSLITGNTATDNGGAIWMGSADDCDCLNNTGVTMSGGALSENKAANGGAIYIETGKISAGMDFNQTGGTVANNDATDNGGAAYISGGNFLMSGGCLGAEDNANTAILGGGVYVSGGAATISGGAVQYNAAKDGAGIYVRGGSATVCDGGSITHNRAQNCGGGAYISGGDFNLNGENASITGNSAADGAGIYLTGGTPNLLVGSMTDNKASGDGGGIYIDCQLVNLKPTGLVTITGNQAKRGGGIFIAGTNGTDACFSVDSADGGSVNLSSNTAEAEGGAVCISKGYFQLTADNITLQDNQANSGGAVAVLSGNFTMSAGAIGAEGHGNSATNGGAVYVGGGNAYISGGDVHYNQAMQNGGGIAVNDGDIYMSGGNVSSNRAVGGAGGGMYVTSSGNSVAIKVYSGRMEQNTAQGSGGAVAVIGSTGSNIEVQIGVNHEHTGGAFKHTELEDTYTHSYCPQIRNNTSNASGGAFYITGGTQTSLNMYCLADGGNSATGDSDINNVPLSDFLMVNGGKVVITTASAENSSCDCGGADCNYSNHDNMGNANIQGSVHVTGGTLDLFGNMDNPSFDKAITVDLTKEEDHYYDHRENDLNIKLVYHENFNYNGIIDSTYTAYDLEVNETATISDSLYKHEGYQIYGWNTDPKADKNTRDGWYDNGKKYLFVEAGTPDEDLPSLEAAGAQAYQYGDLTLYAIWEPNGYWVQFDPDATTYTGDKMENQLFTYNVYAALNPNTYGRVGYTFGGWTYQDDAGETQTLRDQEQVINLTAVKGGTVVLKAIWNPCMHDSGNVGYTVEQKSAQKAVLIKTCLDCGYEATATLTAEDAIYDKNPHPAKVVCSDAVWFNITDIAYSGTKIGKEESVDDPQLVTNAGDYTATITEDGRTAAGVTFTIEKADQPGPAAKPTYTEPEKNSNILYVHPLTAADGTDINRSPETGLSVAFNARYYQDGMLQETGWETVAIDQESGKYCNTPIELTEELKYYFVYARYEGDDNYNPSPETMADGTFLFEGNISLRFIVDPGITYLPGESAKGELEIHVAVDQYHYLAGGRPTIEKKNDEEGLVTINQEDGNNESFTIVRTEVTTDEAHTIDIYIGTSVDKPVITSAVQEKQIFGTVVNDAEPCISPDSAYTVAYTVTHYTQETYQTPVLVFSESVPAGTTVIMLDKSGAKTTYWSYAFESAGSSVALGDFTRMGSSAAFSLDEEYSKLRLQFIVDFSKTTAGVSGDKLRTTLSIAKKTPEDAGAPDLKESTNATVEVALGAATHSLAYLEGTGLTHKFTYTYAAGDAASKWDDRELALIVKIKDPPADAEISAQVNGTWHTVRAYESGGFIIPLGKDRSGTISLTLRSSMIPVTGGTYEAVCRLYAARSIAEAAPLNGSALGEEATCVFAKANQNVAVSITEEDDCHLFTESEFLTVTVNSTLLDGYSLQLQLQQLDSDGTYVNKGRRSESLGNNQFRFALNDLVADSYRIVAIVEDDGGFAVLEAPYYFIIQQTE